MVDIFIILSSIIRFLALVIYKIFYNFRLCSKYSFKLSNKCIDLNRKTSVYFPSVHPLAVYLF